MAYNTKNYTKQGGDEWIVGGKLVVLEGATLEVEGGAAVNGITGVSAAATASTLGGIKASPTTSGYDVPVKIKTADSKLYVPAYPELPVEATEEDAGIVKMAAHVPDAEAEVTVKDFNDLLAALIDAGLMAAPGAP